MKFRISDEEAMISLTVGTHYSDDTEPLTLIRRAIHIDAGIEFPVFTRTEEPEHCRLLPLLCITHMTAQ